MTLIFLILFLWYSYYTKSTHPLLGYCIGVSIVYGVLYDLPIWIDILSRWFG